MEYEFLLITAKLVNGTNFSLVAFLPEFFQWAVLREKDVFHLRIENGISWKYCKWYFFNLIPPLNLYMMRAGLECESAGYKINFWPADSSAGTF